MILKTKKLLFGKRKDDMKHKDKSLPEKIIMEQEVEYKHQMSYSEDSAIYDPKDKTWKVIRKVIQSRSKDGITWETREYSVMAMDKGLEKAHQTALNSVIAKLHPIRYDLFAVENDLEIKVSTIKKGD